MKVEIDPGQLDEILLVVNILTKEIKRFNDLKQIDLLEENNALSKMIAEEDK